jgi:hypothetical protein
MSKPKAFDSWTPEQQEAWLEKKREHYRKYRAANREKIREQACNHYAANREKIREKQRKYCEANREANREKIRERKRLWAKSDREKNPDKSKKAKEKWRRNKGCLTMDEIRARSASTKEERRKSLLQKKLAYTKIWREKNPEKYELQKKKARENTEAKEKKRLHYNEWYQNLSESEKIKRSKKAYQSYIAKHPDGPKAASLKRRKKVRDQAAADQFFIMVGAAQQISEAIGKPNQKTK